MSEHSSLVNTEQSKNIKLDFSLVRLGLCAFFPFQVRVNVHSALHIFCFGSFELYLVTCSLPMSLTVQTELACIVTKSAILDRPHRSVGGIHLDTLPLGSES